MKWVYAAMACVCFMFALTSLREISEVLYHIALVVLLVSAGMALMGLAEEERNR